MVHGSSLGAYAPACPRMAEKPKPLRLGCLGTSPKIGATDQHLLEPLEPVREFALGGVDVSVFREITVNSFMEEIQWKAKL